LSRNYLNAQTSVDGLKRDTMALRDKITTAEVRRAVASSVVSA